MEAVCHQSNHRAFKIALALLLCIACIPAQSLAFVKQAWANAGEVKYGVFYKTSANSYHLVLQEDNTPHPEYGELSSTVLLAENEGNSPFVSEEIERFIIESTDTISVHGQLKAPTSMACFFSGFNGCKSINLSGLDTSNVTDMSFMFNDCASLTSLDLSSLDTSSVTDMNDLFAGCEKLQSVNLSDIDTSRVTNMASMFSKCTSLQEVNLTGLNTSSVTSMNNMFGNCKALKKLDLSGFDTSNVTNLDSMFDGCENLVSLILANWDTSGVASMGGMFAGCTSLASLDLSGWTTSEQSFIRGIFGRCEALENIALSASASQKLGPELLQLGKAWVGPDGNTLTEKDFTAGAPITCHEKGKPQLIFESFVNDLPAMTYRGAPLEPEVAVSFGGQSLTRGVDYDITYRNNNAPGTGQAVITGKGDYTGTVVRSFIILKVPEPDKPTPSQPGSSGNQSSNKPGGNSGSQGGTKPGNSGGSGSGSSKPGSGATTAPPLSGITVGGAGAGGSSLPTATAGTRPPVSIVVGGKKLVEGVDFTVRHIGGDKVGEACLVLTGTGLSKWTRTVKYIVLPAGTAVKKATLGKKSTKLTWGKQASQTDGYQVRYSAKKSMKGAKTKTVKGAKKTSAKLPRVKTGKSLYVQVRTYKKAGGKTYYSPWSARTRVSNPPATSVSKLKKAKRGFTVKWKKQPRKWTTGYQVRYSLKKSMKGAKKLTVKGASKTSAKVSKLKGGKKYYVQVRTYKKVGKKTYYSGWSKAKTVKTKK